MEILLDFDGTVVSHEFPYIGHDIGAVPVLKKLVDKGHKLILFTMRSDHPEGASCGSEEFPNVYGGKYLTEAVRWFENNGIPLYGINTNPTQHNWTSSPKAYGQLMIDDIALGIPLIYNEGSRPYVDWIKTEQMLKETNVL